MNKIGDISPILNVSDMKQSLHLYVDLLGFANAEWGGDKSTGVTWAGRTIPLCRGGQGHPGTSAARRI